MVSIYVLKLENNKFYVGKTNNPIIRLEQHFNNNGSAWTKVNKPIDIIEIIPNCDEFDEDKYTIKYMKQYGIDNVRGGSFCNIELEEEHINTITRMINGSNNKCYNCGGNHFYSFCSLMKKNEYNNCKNNVLTKLICERCERTGHTIDDCYASTDKYGEEIIDYVEVYECEYCGKEFETEKGAQIHVNLYCKNKKTSKKSTKNSCFRCGHVGHYANSCYASK